MEAWRKDERREREREQASIHYRGRERAAITDFVKAVMNSPPLHHSVGRQSVSHLRDRDRGEKCYGNVGRQSLLSFQSGVEKKTVARAIGIGQLKSPPPR